MSLISAIRAHCRRASSRGSSKGALQHAQSALLGGDIDKYAAEVSQLGESLAEQRMPLDEVIASLQLLKNSVRRIIYGEKVNER